jgi:MoaA/NifB/PqqE/SkfB family radical SAM enzyme
MTVAFLQIEPTTRCNFTCGFCAGRSMPQADLRYEKFAEALDAFPDVKHVELQGEGESLLHPRFLDMVALARSRDIKVSFITNGSFLTKETIDKLLTLGIEKVSVSLESADAETFRRVRGGRFDKVVRGIEDLLRERQARGLERPVVGFSITVLRSTRAHLTGIVALYQRLGLDGGVTMQPLERKEEYAKNYDAGMQAETLSDEEADRVWIQFLADREIRKIQKSKKPVPSFFDELMEGWRPGRRTCPWLERGVYLDHEGRATPCCMVKDTKHAYGQLGIDVPESMLRNRDKLRAELSRGVVPEPCRGCELARFATLSKWGMVRYGVKGLWQRWFGSLADGDEAGAARNTR